MTHLYELFKAIKERLSNKEHAEILKELINILGEGGERALKKKIEELMPKSIEEIIKG